MSVLGTVQLEFVGLFLESGTCLLESLPIYQSSFLNITVKRIKRDLEKLEGFYNNDDESVTTYEYDGRKELTFVAYRSEGDVFFCFVVSNQMPETATIDLYRLKALYMELKKDLKQAARNDLSSLRKMPNLQDGAF